MSRLLDPAAMLDEQRAKDLKANDELQAALLQSDLDYLANRERRERQRIAETARMEQAVMTRQGWML